MHCEWSEWGIGDCDKTCGGGLRTKTRSQIQEALHGGTNCTGDAQITESCNVDECPGKFNIIVHDTILCKYY